MKKWSQIRLTMVHNFQSSLFENTQEGYSTTLYLWSNLADLNILCLANIRSRDLGMHLTICIYTTLIACLEELMCKETPGARRAHTTVVMAAGSTIRVSAKIILWGRISCRQQQYTNSKETWRRWPQTWRKLQHFKVSLRSRRVFSFTYQEKKFTLSCGKHLIILKYPPSLSD